MTTTVRVAVPAGQGKGVRIQYGTQYIEIPVGGVQAFSLYDGSQASAVITETDALSDVVPRAGCAQRNYELIKQIDQLKEELAAVKAAVNAVQE